MQVEFLGTAGPMSVPRPLCRCEICQQARDKGVPYSRSCPSLFLHGPNILFDTSEDINFQINRSQIKLNPKKTLLTHINGLSSDELKEVEKKLQAEGLNVEIAYDTLLVDVQ